MTALTLPGELLRTSIGEFPLAEYRLGIGGRAWRVLHTRAVLGRADEADVVGRPLPQRLHQPEDDAGNAPAAAAPLRARVVAPAATRDLPRRFVAD